MTKLLYLTDMSLLQCEARILSVDPSTKTVILDQTPFYPQGGGQASDKGFLSINGRMVEVTSVKKDQASGNVLHFISAPSDLYLDSLVGSKVLGSVDPALRDLNSRCHSAGHLLDHAVEDLNLPLDVRSAYHFLSGPYVEYAFRDDSIDLTPEYLKTLQGQLQTAANIIVQKAIPITVYNGTVADLSPSRQDSIPESVKLSGSVRLVKFEGPNYNVVPCSGTHVTNSAIIKPIVVRKISLNKEKRTIRVSYTINSTINPN